MKCRFEEFLVNYQPDLKRIVGKHLATYLHIKVEDVVGTVNYQLLKNTVFDNTLDYPNDLLKSITMNFIHIHYNFSISGDIFIFYWDTSDVTNITKISITK